ncbi:MAG: hypothetical protein JXR37_29655 [Kiritimatiellae bacterium]|nr:hypothetical protein [Kiritimatiellia bacterium]
MKIDPETSSALSRKAAMDPPSGWPSSMSIACRIRHSSILPSFQFFIFRAIVATFLNAGSAVQNHPRTPISEYMNNPPPRQSAGFTRPVIVLTLVILLTLLLIPPANWLKRAGHPVAAMVVLWSPLALFICIGLVFSIRSQRLEAARRRDRVCIRIGMELAEAEEILASAGARPTENAESGFREYELRGDTLLRLAISGSTVSDLLVCPNANVHSPDQPGSWVSRHMLFLTKAKERS